MPDQDSYPQRNHVGFLRYGSVSDAFFLGVFLCAIGFVDNIPVPKSSDFEPVHSWWVAGLINLGVLGLSQLVHAFLIRNCLDAGADQPHGG